VLKFVWKNMHQSRTLGRTRPGVTFEQIIGNRVALESVIEQVGQVAPTDSPVIIDRETGTGNLLLTQAVFTSAIEQKIELFETAGTRTLFLDDVNAGSLPSVYFLQMKERH
jgi:transcriptional regulator with GAF, ATPase, and Fis domain